MLIRSATNFGAMTTRRVRSGFGRSWPETWPTRCGPRGVRSETSRRDVAAGRTGLLVGQPGSLAGRRAIDAQRAGHAS